MLRISLTISRLENKSFEFMAGSTHSQNSTSIEAKRLHVLLIEPDLRSLASAAGILESFSYKVTTAKTGRSALSILSDPEFKIDLVLTEIELPDIDGLIVVKEAVAKEVPIIPMLSDNVDHMAINMAVRHGATFFLHKPISSVVVEGLWMHVARKKFMAANGGEINIGSLEPVDDNSDGDQSDEFEANCP